MTQATCTRCGETFKAQARGRPRKYCHVCQPGRSGRHATCECCGEPTAAGQRYCHESCNEHDAWERRSPPLQVADCKGCGEQYVRVLPSRFAYCSLTCKLEQRKELDRQRYHKDGAGKRKQKSAYQRERLLASALILADWKPALARLALPPARGLFRCARCERWHSAPRRKYCTPECSSEAKRQLDRAAKQRPAIWVGGYCAECSEPFVTSRTTGRYCSTACAKTSIRRRGKHIRRARLKTVRTEAINMTALADRDGWRCHICKRKVTRKNWSHDHLIPLSQGGSHSYDNVALAHHRCNTLRGAHGAAQLRLAA